MKTKALWIKKPKCAGTSVLNLFKELDVLYMIESIPGANSEILLSVMEKKVVCVRNCQLFRLEEKCPDVVAAAWKFAVIRNPWDKFVSSWKYCNSTKNRKMMDVLLNLPEKDTEPHDWHHLTRTQWEFLVNRDGELRCDFFVRFEHLQEDLNRVFSILGLPTQTIPHDNRTKRRPYSKYYNDETRELVAEIYKKDIEGFGYDFENGGGAKISSAEPSSR